MAEINKYKRYILEKLYTHTYIGGKHTHEDNIPKGLPRKEHKEAGKALKQLIREGYILIHVKPDGRHVSLQPSRIEEVRRILGIK